MDIKVFYLFDSQKQEIKKTQESQIEIDVSIDKSSQNIKNDFSLKDIMALNVEELSTKIFVFDPKFNKTEVANMNEKGCENIEKIIQSLRCMVGINKKYIPKFKFI